MDKVKRNITVQGVIRDEMTGKGIEKIYVFACRPGKPTELDFAETKSDGKYELNLRNVDNYILDIADNRNSTRWENIVVPGNPGDKDWKNADRVLRKCDTDETARLLVNPRQLGELIEWYRAPKSGLMAITGPPRSGKSTLVRSFLKYLREDKANVFYFSCENSSDLTSLFCHLSNWVKERGRFKFDPQWRPSSRFLRGDEPNSWEREFLIQLKFSPKCLFVLDGLEKRKVDEQTEELNDLLENLLKRISAYSVGNESKVLLTTHFGDEDVFHGGDFFTQIVTGAEKHIGHVMATWKQLPQGVRDVLLARLNEYDA